jgi:hypothetical protein
VRLWRYPCSLFAVSAILRRSVQACGRAQAAASKTFARFLLATLRHTGPVHIKLLDTPCLLRIFLLHCAAFLQGFYPRVIHGRSGVRQLDQRRRISRMYEFSHMG